MGKAVYQISGTGYGNLDYCKSMGFMDACMNGHGMDHVSQDFVNQCKSRGMTPIYFGGNDSHPTCEGQDVNVCYQGLANMGHQCAGGESTSAGEMMAAQQHITFINAGGEGITPNQDSFGNLGFQVVKGGKGVISYIESYNFPATLVYNDCINAMVHAANVGCLEVGIMIGGWMPVESAIYIQLARDFENRGHKFGGFHLWWGIGTDMAATIQKWAQPIHDFQAIWPPDMRDLKTRIAGGAGGETPVAVDNTPEWMSLLFS